jgi:hypothetical protein
LKRTFLLSILALVSATLLPAFANCQVSSSSGRGSADAPETNYRYEAYVGYGYTSLNQVNLSRYGLQGVRVSITRDFGKYFGVTADGAAYQYPIGSPVVTGTTTNPTADTVLFGPVIHADLYGKYSGFVHALIGGEHTGGAQQTPNISFAGGFGGGLEYKVNPRISVRAMGDYIGASFSLTGNTTELGLSPHRTWNPQASIGVVYHF